MVVGRRVPRRSGRGCRARRARPALPPAAIARRARPHGARRSRCTSCVAFVLARRGRLRLAALPAREVAEDDQGGGQAGVTPAATSPPRCEARSAGASSQQARKPHDGRRRRPPTSSSPTRPTSPWRCATTARSPAPEVVAKGADLVAAAIRERPPRHGVPVLTNPPLARALYREVEIGQQIPDDFFRPSPRCSRSSTAPPAAAGPRSAHPRRRS